MLVGGKCVLETGNLSQYELFNHKDRTSKEKETLPSEVDRECAVEKRERHAVVGLYRQHCPEDLEKALGR